MLKYLFFTLFFVSSLVNADVPAEQVKEVDYLLSFIKSSNCIINRNGSNHPAEKGVRHIERKYDYFRDDIQSTEDFIKYSATKSTMSGKFYTVKCPDAATIKTQDWLLMELQLYRFH